MLTRTARRLSNAHPPLKPVAALVAAMFIPTAPPVNEWVPSDLSLQYQDSGGTLPVSNVEQPVGLVLDRSKGGAKRGADVVLNGGFNDASAWTSPAPSAAIANGVLNVVAAPAGTQLIVQANRVVIGKIYEVTFDVVTFSSGGISVGTTGSAGTLSTGAGRFRDVFVAASTTLAIFSRSTVTNATVDNVQVREVTGPNLWQGTPTVKDANWTDNGDGSFTSNGSSGLLGWPTTPPKLTIGRTYECIVRITSRTAGQFTLPYDGAGSNNTNAVSSVGTFRRIITATTTGLYIYSTNFNGTVDSVYIAEIPGIHRVQPSAPSRPYLQARVNMLTYSEQISNAAWAKTTGGTGSAPVVTDNFGVAPDGTTTAARVQFALNGGTTTSDISLLRQVLFNNPIGGTYTHDVWLKTNDGSTRVIQQRDDQAGTVGRLLTVTGAWQQFTFTSVSAGTTTIGAIGLWLRGAQGTADSADLLMWRPQFNYGQPTRYQRIAAVADYDSVGFARGWRYDGLDDGWYTTANIDLSGTDKVSIVAALRKLSDAATAIVIEFSPNFTTNNGTFFVAAPNGGTSFSFASKGTTQAVTAPSGYPSPFQAIVMGQADIGAATSWIRVNGSVAATTATSMGTGNFGSYLAYFGRRNNNALPFTGIEYGMRLFGRRLSPDEGGWLEAAAKLDMNNNL